jgi:hypothetical protein
MDATKEDPASADPAFAPADLVRRWLDLSELNRRVFLALTHEVSESADLVERGVIDLITCFHALDASASGQADCIERVATLLGTDPADARARDIAESLAEVRTLSAAIVAVVSRMVTCIQFEDRTRQHLAHISNTLSVLGTATVTLRDDTRDQVATLAWDGGIDDALLQRILEGQTLGAVHQRFLQRLLMNDSSVLRELGGAANSTAEGEIDLF